MIPRKYLNLEGMRLLGSKRDYVTKVYDLYRSLAGVKDTETDQPRGLVIRVSDY